jgi:hypothetical protein
MPLNDADITIPPPWKYFQKIAGRYRRAGIGLKKCLLKLENSTPDRPGSYKTGKLEGLKARKFPGFLASWPPSLQAMALSLEL